MAAMNRIATVTEASKRNRTALRNPVAMTAQTRSAVVVHRAIELLISLARRDRVASWRWMAAAASSEAAAS